MVRDLKIDEGWTLFIKNDDDVHVLYFVILVCQFYKRSQGNTLSKKPLHCAQNSVEKLHKETLYSIMLGNALVLQYSKILVLSAESCTS